MPQTHRNADAVGLVAVAAHLPSAVRTSAEVEARIAAAGGWAPPAGIVEAMTGIRRRHVLADDEQASDLAAAAARKVLAETGTDARDVDLLVFASASQDLIEPATAAITADLLGTRCPVLDVTNACNSFLNGVQVAEALIRTGQAGTALVVVGESPSRAIRWDVRSIAELRAAFAGYTFGDAGAAALLRRTAGLGIVHRAFQTDARHWRLGTLPAGGSRHPRGDEWTTFRGDGTRLRDAFRSIGPGLVHDALRATSTSWDDYAKVLVHQVTLPFLEDFRAATGIPAERLVVTLPETGNIAAATLPLQHATAVARGEIVPGDLVMWIGLAGGASLGVVVLVA